ncbi:hypothetical protein B0A49_11068 [Cryomyces minteri]|uniref:LicD/FKTN/FKRP nucleotidyltransferase domain-containing protein n=1 Tax=Cryomyces minteri TaxID=331657 RepID=A0A4U0WFM2_9PEZI|nr:hypothetical protein B0A49_11068 [Cryomyces minteri]
MPVLETTDFGDEGAKVRDEVQELGEETEEGPQTTDTKYFHEPGGDDILGHYDKRYFHGVVSYGERTDTLRHMVRAYLDFFRKEGLETWISHGTLLGWWWNGQMLPWDWDLDTQVSGTTLVHLAKTLNYTTHTYTSPDRLVSRNYLLDINPWSRERERGDGMNIIDARWIDVRNGLYVDITGLSETHPDVQPGVWSCKNYHRYRTSDLYPLRDSVFEGVRAKIPYAYGRILIDEYREQALIDTEYEGHFWSQDRREWVKIPERSTTELEADTAKRLEPDHGPVPRPITPSGPEVLQ